MSHYPLVYTHPPHTYRDKCPGQKECDAAIDSLNATINQLDQAVLAAMSQQLQPYASSTLQGFQVCVCVCWVGYTWVGHVYNLLIGYEDGSSSTLTCNCLHRLL